MDHFAGLDVSVKETSVCIVDDIGRIVREVKVASEPEALLAVLKNPAYRFQRIGLEAFETRFNFAAERLDRLDRWRLKAVLKSTTLGIRIVAGCEHNSREYRPWLRQFLERRYHLVQSRIIWEISHFVHELGLQR